MTVQYRYIQIHYDNSTSEVVAIADRDEFRDKLSLPMDTALNQFAAEGWRLVGQSVTPSQCEPHDPHLLYFHMTFMRERG
jgi:hypothetical protein